MNCPPFSLTADGTTLYAGRAEGVRAFDVKDGTVAWERSCSGLSGCSDGATPLSMAATADTVYAALGGDQLAAFATGDDADRWQRITPHRVARLALTGEAVYAVGDGTDPLVRFVD